MTTTERFKKKKDKQTVKTKEKSNQNDF